MQTNGGGGVGRGVCVCVWWGLRTQENWRQPPDQVTWPVLPASFGGAHRTLRHSFFNWELWCPPHVSGENELMRVIGGNLEEKCPLLFDECELFIESY